MTNHGVSAGTSCNYYNHILRGAGYRTDRYLYFHPTSYRHDQPELMINGNFHVYNSEHLLTIPCLMVVACSGLVLVEVLLAHGCCYTRQLLQCEL